MLRWATALFVITVVAALLGFGGITSGAAEVTRILIFVFAPAFIVTVIIGVQRKYQRP